MYVRRPSLMQQKQVQDCIEALCQKGCRSVRESIMALEHGEKLPETRGLTAEQVQVVLDDLKAVMAVYGDVCPP